MACLDFCCSVNWFQKSEKILNWLEFLKINWNLFWKVESEFMHIIKFALDSVAFSYFLMICCAQKCLNFCCLLKRALWWPWLFCTKFQSNQTQYSEVTLISVKCNCKTKSEILFLFHDTQCIPVYYKNFRFS